MESLYRDLILSHYRNPLHRHRVEGANIHGSANHPLCGDELSISARLDAGRVAEAGFEARACSIVHASADMMVELVQGRSLAEALELAELFEDMMLGPEAPPAPELSELAVLQGVRKYPVRVKCALLPWSTLQAALQGSRGV